MHKRQRSNSNIDDPQKKQKYSINQNNNRIIDKIEEVQKKLEQPSSKKPLKNFDELHQLIMLKVQQQALAELLAIFNDNMSSLQHKKTMFSSHCQSFREHSKESQRLLLLPLQLPQLKQLYLDIAIILAGDATPQKIVPLLLPKISLVQPTVHWISRQKNSTQTYISKKESMTITIDIVELSTANIDIETITEKSIIVGTQLLSLNEIIRFDFFLHQKLYHQLTEEYPDIADALYSYNSFFEKLKINIKLINSMGATPRQKIAALIRGLRAGGERVTKQAYAPQHVHSAIKSFYKYYKQLPKLHRKQIKELKNFKGATFAAIMKRFKLLECIEQIADSLECLLTHNEKAPCLSTPLLLTTKDINEIKSNYSDAKRIKDELILCKDNTAKALPAKDILKHLRETRLPLLLQLIKVLQVTPVYYYSLLLKGLDLPQTALFFPRLADAIENGYFSYEQVYCLTQLIFSSTTIQANEYARQLSLRSILSYAVIIGDNRLVDFLIKKNKPIDLFQVMLNDNKTRKSSFLFDEKISHQHQLLATLLKALDKHSAKLMSQENEDGHTVLDCILNRIKYFPPNIQKDEFELVKLFYKTSSTEQQEKFIKKILAMLKVPASNEDIFLVSHMLEIEAALKLTDIFLDNFTTNQRIDFFNYIIKLLIIINRYSANVTSIIEIKQATLASLGFLYKNSSIIQKNYFNDIIINSINDSIEILSDQFAPSTQYSEHAINIITYLLLIKETDSIFCNQQEFLLSTTLKLMKISDLNSQLPATIATSLKNFIIEAFDSSILPAQLKSNVNKDKKKLDHKPCANKKQSKEKTIIHNVDALVTLVSKIYKTWSNEGIVKNSFHLFFWEQILNAVYMTKDGSFTNMLEILLEENVLLEALLSALPESQIFLLVTEEISSIYRSLLFYAIPYPNALTSIFKYIPKQDLIRTLSTTDYEDGIFLHHILSLDESVDEIEPNIVLVSKNIMAILNILKEQQKMADAFKVIDSNGNNTLHTVLKNSDKITLCLPYLSPELLKELYDMKNKKGETILHSAANSFYSLINIPVLLTYFKQHKAIFSTDWLNNNLLASYKDSGQTIFHYIADRGTADSFLYLLHMMPNAIKYQAMTCCDLKNNNVLSLALSQGKHLILEIALQPLTNEQKETALKAIIDSLTQEKYIELIEKFPLCRSVLGDIVNTQNNSYGSIVTQISLQQNNVNDSPQPNDLPSAFVNNTMYASTMLDTDNNPSSSDDLSLVDSWISTGTEQNKNSPDDTRMQI